MTALIAIATLLLCVQPQPSNQSKIQKENEPGRQKQSAESKSTVAVGGDSQNPNPKSGTQGSSAPKDDTLTKIYLASGAIAAAVSIGIFILVWKQISVMRGIERAQVDLDFLSSGQYTYTVMLSNHGKSIAIITCYSFIHASYPLVAKDLRPDEALAKHEDGWSMYAMLPPSTPAKNWMSYDLRTDLGEETLNNPDRQTIISGLVEYTDIFGKGHETEVVYRYSFPSRKLEPLWQYGKFT
jgi:hypothetical protein